MIIWVISKFSKCINCEKKIFKNAIYDIYDTLFHKLESSYLFSMP